jgi:hypothetical protein
MKTYPIASRSPPNLQTYFSSSVTSLCSPTSYEVSKPFKVSLRSGPSFFRLRNTCVYSTVTAHVPSFSRPLGVDTFLQRYAFLTYGQYSRSGNKGLKNFVRSRGIVGGFVGGFRSRFKGVGAFQANAHTSCPAPSFSCVTS